MQEAETVTENSSLISSDNVNGTRVYSLDGEHVGDIDHLMIDRQTGNVAYAVMTFGGLLGIGQDSHPIPWNKLTYDTSLEGYRTDIDRRQLEGAPARPDNWHRDRKWERSLYDHYGTLPYWM